MLPVLLLAVCCAVPVGEPVAFTCDLVELTHFFDGEGRTVFDQVIYWNWHPEEYAYRVRAWRRLKSSQMRPRRSRAGAWRAVWWDGERLREVRSGSFCETWTQYDPELLDSRDFPKGLRLDLPGSVRRALGSRRPP